MILFIKGWCARLRIALLNSSHSSHTRSWRELSFTPAFCLRNISLISFSVQSVNSYTCSSEFKIASLVSSSNLLNFNPANDFSSPLTSTDSILLSNANLSDKKSRTHDNLCTPSMIEITPSSLIPYVGLIGYLRSRESIRSVFFFLFHCPSSR